MFKYYIFIGTFLLIIGMSVNVNAIGPLETEKTKLLKSIQCSRQSSIPPSDGLGSLWSCYNINEEVKLWINGQADNVNEIRNIKLSAIQWHGKKLDVTGKIWAKILLEEYSQDEIDVIMNSFQSCPMNKTYNSENFKISVKCTNGPKADEHILLIKPK